MALGVYNELSVEETEILKIENLNPDQAVPLTDDNLIYKTICNFYRETGKVLPNFHIIQNDNIPMASGLGSSAACIVGGLLAANSLSGANLSKDDLVQMAVGIEGHSDNVAPAMLGGMVVGAIDKPEAGGRVHLVKLDVPKNLAFTVFLPSFPLHTSLSRSVLPKTYSRQDAVFNISRAALLVAAMATGNMGVLKTATADCLHQPYRQHLVPNMEEIFEKAYNYGASGVYLSGAGPAIIAITCENNEFKSNMENFLNSLNNKWNTFDVEIDVEGARFLS